MLNLKPLLQEHLPAVLVIANLSTFTLFLVLRPPATNRLDEKDVQFVRGEVRVKSGDPMYVAGRAVGGSRWHGTEGESSAAFDAYLLILNAPALLAATRIDDAAYPYLFRLAFRDTAAFRDSIGGWFFTFISWSRAALFTVTSTLQWLCVGWVLRRMARSRLAQHGNLGPNPALQRTHSVRR